MTVLTQSIYAKATTDVLGIGVTIDSSGAVTAVTGPTIRYVTAAPTATANGGSLAMRSNGSLYITAGGGVWVLIGGASVGWNLPDDVIGSWGTTSPLQVQSVYVSASNRWDLRGIAISQATAQASPTFRVGTGATTITGAVAGAASGDVAVQTGDTDSTNAGGTGGNSGAITLNTGAALSTLGTSGNSGAVSLVSGNSADGNSGAIVLTTGTATGTRGAVDINSPTIDTTTQVTQLQIIDNSKPAFQIGSTGALDMLGWDTTNGAEALDVGAVGGVRFADNIPAKFGTLVNDRVWAYYSSGSSAFLIAGTDVAAGGVSQNTRKIQVGTGARELTDAAGSPSSGQVVLSTGNSTVNFAGGGATGGASGSLQLGTGNTNVLAGANTAGNSGQIIINTGSSLSTAGTSGSSGLISIATGDSEDANSGAITVASGTAQAAGAVSSGAMIFRSGTVGGTGTTGNVTIASGAASGAGTSGTVSIAPGSVAAGGTRGVVAITGIQTQSVSASAISAARVLERADSGGVFSVSQAAAYAITLPSPTVGSGLVYRFFLSAAAANSVTVVVSGGAATFIGTIVNDVTSVLPATGSTLTFVSGTAALGDNIEVYSLATNLYGVRAVTSTNGGITIT